MRETENMKWNSAIIDTIVSFDGLFFKIDRTYYRSLLDITIS